MIDCEIQNKIFKKRQTILHTKHMKSKTSK